MRHDTAKVAEVPIYASLESVEERQLERAFRRVPYFAVVGLVTDRDERDRTLLSHGIGVADHRRAGVGQVDRR